MSMLASNDGKNDRKQAVHEATGFTFAQLRSRRLRVTPELLSPEQDQADITKPSLSTQMWGSPMNKRNAPVRADQNDLLTCLTYRQCDRARAAVNSLQRGNPASRPIIAFRAVRGSHPRQSDRPVSGRSAGFLKLFLNQQSKKPLPFQSRLITLSAMGSPLYILASRRGNPAIQKGAPEERGTCRASILKNGTLK